MAKVKFYTDVHIAKAVVHGLTRRGVDALSCVDNGQREADDDELLARATQEKRVMVTHDNDFLVFHSQGFPHGGIAFFTRPTSVGEMIRSLLLIYEVLEAEEMVNHVEFL